MALTLIVQPGWCEQVAAVWQSYPRIVPVLKGNGYGFGRSYLAGVATDLGADEIAVGSVYELAGLQEDRDGQRPMTIILTPCLAPDIAELDRWPDAIVTIGSHSDVDVLRDDRGSAICEPSPTSDGVILRRRVIVKIESSMRRYGVPAVDARHLADRARQAGCDVHGFALHLPLEQTAEAGLAEAMTALGVVPDGSALYVSHLSAQACVELQRTRPLVRIRPRIGTALWLGDKRNLSLVADVAVVHSVRAGELVGYRQQPAPGDGWIVIVAAGTAHGVQPLPDGRSPFHFSRQRLSLCEPPHMHTSMCFVPAGTARPAVGDQVDVQQPLTRVHPDRIVRV